jgi:hypothetical protein
MEFEKRRKGAISIAELIKYTKLDNLEHLPEFSLDDIVRSLPLSEIARMRPFQNKTSRNYATNSDADEMLIYVAGLTLINEEPYLIFSSTKEYGVNQINPELKAVANIEHYQTLKKATDLENHF